MMEYSPANTSVAFTNEIEFPILPDPFEDRIVIEHLDDEAPPRRQLRSKPAPGTRFKADARWKDTQ